MDRQLNTVCGADIHKKFLVATILSRDGTRITRRFGMAIEDLMSFKEWVIDNGCERVAVESTGRLWIPIHIILEGAIELVVANAHKIKHIPGRKTDLSDSEWIAELCLNGMIEPSRIFHKEARELRSLTRAREGYIRDLTREKNRIHQVLESCSIKLSSVLSDIFGKTGLFILRSLISGISVEEIIKKLPVKKLKSKADDIREAIVCGLDVTDILLIKGALEHIAHIKNRIEELDQEIRCRIAVRNEEMKILYSIPGVGYISAVTIIAEIGNYLDFKRPEQLASWAGIVPSVYQSADKLVTGCITKHGSCHLRWILVQVAHAVALTKNSKLKRFFLRVRAKKGYNVAIVALARKLLCIIHHLLINKEEYAEERNKVQKRFLSETVGTRPRLSLEEMISCLVSAGYEVNKKDSGRTTS